MNVMTRHRFRRFLGTGLAMGVLLTAGVVPGVASVATAADVPVADEANLPNFTPTPEGTLPPSLGTLSVENSKKLTRDQILERGKSWVDVNVKYTQGGAYTNQYGTYRRDCSGFLSMSWGLNPSGMSAPSTRTLGTFANTISYDDLKPGDALNSPGNHTILFVGWNDAARTSIKSYEQTTFGGIFDPDPGAIRRPATYAAWTVATLKAQEYTAIRYKNVVEESTPPPPPPPAPKDYLNRNLEGNLPWDDIALLSEGHRLFTAAGMGDGNFYGREEIVPANPLPDGFDGIVDVAIGQVTRDDLPDLVLKHEDGTIYRMANNGDGGYTSPVQIATGWQNIVYFAVGDVAGRGDNDLVGVSASGTLYRALRDPDSEDMTYFSKVAFGDGWDGLEDFTVADVTGEDGDEIIGLDSNTGQVSVAEFWQSGQLGARRPFASGWVGAKELAVGDFNGDEQADFVGIKGHHLYRQIARTTDDEAFYSVTQTDGGVEDWELITDLG
jgi:hypothetical protein